MRPGGLQLGALAALLAVLSWLGGCTTTVQGSDGRDIPTQNEPADAERRARVRLELAALYFGRGQGTTALEEVQRALAAKPDLADAFSLRGLVQASLGDNTLAEASFRRALELAPRDGGVMHNFGWFLCQQRRFDDADAQFVAAVTQPGYRDVPRTLLAQGVCQARAGLWTAAERSLSRAFELDPANPAASFNLAEVLLHRGELERARFYVRRVNAQPEQVSAQSLWLAARIERRMGNMGELQSLGSQLRERFPQSPENQQFERGRFDE